MIVWKAGVADKLAAYADWIAAHAETHLPFVAEVDGYVVGVAWLLLAERVPGNGSLDRWYGNVQSVMVREKHPKPCTHPTMEIGQLETTAEKPG